MVSWFRKVDLRKELNISVEIEICDYGRMWFSWIQRHPLDVVICARTRLETKR